MLGFSHNSWARVSKEALWSLFTQVSIAVSGLVGLRIFTELAPKDVFGYASLVLGIVGLFKSFFVAPLTNAQIRYQPEYDALGVGQWFKAAVLRHTVRLCTVSAGVGIPALVIWNTYSDFDIGVGIYVVAVAVLTTECIESVFANPVSSRRNQRYTSWWNVVKNWAFVIFGAAALHLSATTFSYLVGQVTATFAAFLVFGVFLYPRVEPDRGTVSPQLRAEVRRKIWRYALPFPALALIGWFASVGERYVLGGALGAEEVALFVAAYSVSSRPIMMISGIVTMFARPILFQAESVHDTQKARKVFLLWGAGLVITLGSGVLALWLLQDLIAYLALAKEYREGAKPFFLWIGLTHALWSIYQLVETRLMSLGRTARMIVPTTLIGVVNVALAYALVGAMGPIAVAQAKLFAFGVGLLVALMVLARTTVSTDPARASCPRP